MLKHVLKKMGHLSDLFPCKTGLRQGDNLSPLLFSLYLNDLSDTLVNASPVLSCLYETISNTLPNVDMSLYKKSYSITLCR